MSLPSDHMSVEALEAVSNAGRLMDAILELGDKVGELVIKGSRLDQILGMHEDTLDELAGQLAELPVVFSFSGLGFTPVILPDGEAVGYTEGRHVSGRFCRAHITDPVDQGCIDREEVELEFGIGKIAGGAFGEEDELEFEIEEVPFYDEEDKARAHELLDSLHKPPSGIQLIVDFEVDRQPNTEQSIVGECIRAEGFSIHHLMPTLGLSIDRIDIAGPEPVGSEEVMEGIANGSEKMQQMMHDPYFLHLSPEDQFAEVSALAELINEKLERNPVDIIIKTDEFYSPELSSDTPTMKRVDVDDVVACLPFRIMYADMVKTHEVGDTIGLGEEDGLHAQLCIAGQIDVASSKILGLPSPIIWIPVQEQETRMYLVN